MGSVSGRGWFDLVSLGLAAPGVEALAVVATLALGGCGGASKPLDGTWIVTEPLVGDGNETVTLTLNADGTYGNSATGACGCSGTLSSSGTWSSTASTLTLSGRSCMGAVTCGTGMPGVSIRCGAKQTGIVTCAFSLSGDQSSLTLGDCRTQGEGGPDAGTVEMVSVTYTRSP